MATARVNGLTVGYEVIGERGRPWVLTPGGRDARDTPGLRETARTLAERGNRVLVWDRPNTGESDVCFTGESESAMQADVLAGLLRQLGLAPAVIAGGSGGSRVSLLAASRHPDVASALALWWISGGVYGLLSVGMHYCGESIRAAWEGGMAAVADLPAWAEVIARNPGNRDRFLAQHPAEFIAVLERWLTVYCPNPNEPVPGLTTDRASTLDIPALVLRSGTADIHHRRETSEILARLLPAAQLAEPPWGDAEWPERQSARTSGTAPGLFIRWPLLTPTLHKWATSALPTYKEA
ncbi:alpha/beta hydrolase [Actinocorallia sp. A-T 12471]|uniref:alpha/beta fold hydrolase n=1 Tax=Actinocorallia sp. A-T 12471 TaxID=3089813 RepID=UPI0029CE7943|nr:alpha/beta hydrolase [Actinocorallia sp. A-T 12471]MDX6745139.1 alpha/beta hydrolase [Actinocorallia sp. A-T 12471]